MKCYAHAREGEDRDAVAVCAVCGMGLCMEHAVEREVPLVRRVSGWVGQTTMHVLCERCAKATGLTA